VRRSSAGRDDVLLLNSGPGETVDEAAQCEVVSTPFRVSKSSDAEVYPSSLSGKFARRFRD
jgi:hypothetical protein